MTLTEIGEGRNTLLCITNKTDCCKDTNEGDRQWYFPNNGLVRIKGSSDDFYRDRSRNVVRLNRRNNAMSPTGIFRCDIPSSVHMSNNIYIGIYQDGQGNM